MKQDFDMRTNFQEKSSQKNIFYKRFAKQLV